MRNLLPDRIEKLSGGSVIQHGQYNNRIYLLKLGESATEKLPTDLIQMAERYGYSKVFAKIPSSHSPGFHHAGYVEEASIPRFYNGSETCLFMARYLNDRRAEESDTEILDAILHLALSKAKTSITPFGTSQFMIRRCEEKDVDNMASIYRKNFSTYPFPIHDPFYLLDTMQKNVIYFGVEADGELVALSSAEIDKSASNVEMTDFATLIQWQRNNFSSHLLLRMDREMKQIGIKTAYTISRAISPGMNVTFARLGYSYGGRLKNNTNIYADIETMNVWFKTLS